MIEGDEKIWADMYDLAGMPIRLTLESAGYHRQQAGRVEGRKRRRAIGGPESPAAGIIASPSPRPPRADVLDALTRAAAGDEGGTNRLGEMFRSDPSGVMELCRDELASRAWLAFVERMGVHPGEDEQAVGDEHGGDPMGAGEIVLADASGPELAALAERAKRGDKGALAEIRRALAGQPERLIGLGGGDMARNVELVKVARFAGNDDLRFVAVRAKLDRLRAELARN